jgi:hypothetical protein
VITARIRASLLALSIGAGLTGPVGVDLDGHPVIELAPAGARAVV